MRDILDHIISRILGVKLDPDPYPHFFVDNVFPKDFYAKLLLNLPDKRKYVPLDDRGDKTEENNSCRSILKLEPNELERLDPKENKFWSDLAAALESEPFTSAITSYTFAHLKQRFFGKSDLSVRSSTMLCRFGKGYALGPHPDSPHKIVSIIFYLAPDTKKKELGTSVYIPLDPGFRCVGGPHYDFSEFKYMETAPYEPNSLFGFVKTDNSFHGVETLTEPNIARDTLAYNLTLG